MQEIEEFGNYLKTISKENWNKLFDLIPEIQKTTEFGKNHIGEESIEGYNTFPWMEESEIVINFCELIDKLDILVIFDWVNWEEGRKILENKNFNYGTLEILDLCKIITSICRADRFCGGLLVSYFENGIILKILKSLKNKMQKT